MNLFSKKGQTEDILADLIPAIVIMIIAIYLLSDISSTHETNIAKRVSEVRLKLSKPIDFITYLNSPVESLYGIGGECAATRSTTADVISQIDPKTKGDCYSLLVDMTNNFNKKYFQTVEKPPMWQGADEAACLAVKMDFPEGTTLTLPDCPPQNIFEQNTTLPLKNGGYVNITFSIGITFLEDSDQEKNVQ